MINRNACNHAESNLSNAEAVYFRPNHKDTNNISKTVHPRAHELTSESGGDNISCECSSNHTSREDT